MLIREDETRKITKFTKRNVVDISNPWGNKNEEEK